MKPKTYQYQPKKTYYTPFQTPKQLRNPRPHHTSSNPPALFQLIPSSLKIQGRLASRLFSVLAT